MRAVGLTLLLLVLAAACAVNERPENHAITREQQAALTPQQVIDRLRLGNQRFVQGRPFDIKDRTFQAQTAKSQHPAVAFIDCIDSRVLVDVIFDLSLGDAFSANVAGNIVNPDVLGSIEYGCQLAGSKLVVVLGHTSCGAVKGACDDVRLGNLTQLLEKVRPAIDSVPDDGTPRTSKNHAFTRKVAIANVRLMVQRVRDESPVLRALEEKGTIRIVGALYDVETGVVSWLD